MKNININVSNLEDLDKQALKLLAKQVETANKLVEEALENKKLSKQEASKLIAEKRDQAVVLIRECEEIAKEADVSFSFSLGYGMGGTFMADEIWDKEKNDYVMSGEYSWQSSSSRC